MNLHKEQPGDAIEHNWTKAAAGSEEQSVEAEMPLPGGGRAQQSAASPQLIQHPDEPEGPYRNLTERPCSPVLSVTMMSDTSCHARPNLTAEESRNLTERPCSPLSSVAMMSDTSCHARPNLTAEESRTSTGQVQCDICECPNPAVKGCATCRAFYCMNCIRHHYTCPDLEGHQLEDLQHGSRCELHNKKLTFYCRTDQSAICSRCLLQNHKGHDVIEQENDEDQEMSEQFNKGDVVPPPGPIWFPSVQPNSVTVSWSPPEGAPGSYRYRVTWRGGKRLDRMEVAGCELKVTSLHPAEKYHFTVCSLSEDGHQSTLVEASKYTEVPMPENLTVDSSFTALKWTKPEGVDEVAFFVGFISSSNGETVKNIYTKDPHYPISDLQDGIEYNVQVATLKNYRQSNPITKCFTKGPVPCNKLNLVLYGSSAAAKASAAALLLGEQTEPSPQTSSVCVKREGEVCGRHVTLVLLPALQQTQISEEALWQEAQQCLTLCDPGIHAFILAFPQCPHNDNDDNRELDQIQDLFGTEAEKFFIYLQTQQQTEDTDISETATQAITETVKKRTYILNGSFKSESLLDGVEQVKAENGYYTTEMFFRAQVKSLLNYKSQLTDTKTAINELHIEMDKLQGNSQGLEEVADSLRIVLVGRTGQGKSSTGNTILGREVFRKGSDFTSVTTTCQKEIATVYDRQITVVDTPGLFDTDKDNEETKKEVSRCIGMAAPGPHVFLLVIKLGRFSKEQKDVVDIIRTFFGNKYENYTVVLFTMKDSLKGKSLDEMLLKAGDDLNTLLKKINNRYYAIDNIDKANKSQVTELFDIIDKMVKVNGGRYYTNEKFLEAEKALIKEQKRILREGEEERDKEKGKIQAKHEAAIEKLNNQMTDERKKQEEEWRRRNNELKQTEEKIKSTMQELEEDERTKCLALNKEYKRRIDKAQMERKKQQEEWEKKKQADQMQREKEEVERKKKEVQQTNELTERQRQEQNEFNCKMEGIVRALKEDEIRKKQEYEEMVKKEDEKQKELEEKIRHAQETVKTLEDQKRKHKEECQRKSLEEEERIHQEEIKWRTWEKLQEYVKEKYERKTQEERQRRAEEEKRRLREEEERKKLEQDAEKKIKEKEDHIKKLQQEYQEKLQEYEKVIKRKLAQKRSEMEAKLKLQRQAFEEQIQEAAHKSEERKKREMESLQEKFEVELKLLRKNAELEARKRAEEQIS